MVPDNTIELIPIKIKRILRVAKIIWKLAFFPSFLQFSANILNLLKVYCKFIVSVCKCWPPVSPIEMSETLIYFSQYIFIECFLHVQFVPWLIWYHQTFAFKLGEGSIFISFYQNLGWFKYLLPYDLMKLFGHHLCIGFFDNKLSLTKYSVRRLKLRTILSKFKAIEESNLHEF